MGDSFVPSSSMVGMVEEGMLTAAVLPRSKRFGLGEGFKIWMKMEV